MKLLLSLLIAIVAYNFAQAELIPAHRLPTYTAGVTSGTGVYGGIYQYLDGGANQRIVLETLSADATGATSVHVALQAAIDTMGSAGKNKVKIPYGVYKLSTAVSGAYRDNWTLSGSGQFAPSHTANTIGTGTKTFTVAPGLGYTAGIGVWVWPFDRWNIKISSLTRSGGTATAVTAAPHGYATGMLIEIRHSTETGYNGGHIITVTDANTFTFPISTGVATTATGSWIVTFAGITVPVSSITRSGTTATVTTTQPHLMDTGRIALIAGCDQPEYNMVTTSNQGANFITVTSATTFTYTVSGSPTTPATGSNIRAGSAYHGGPQFAMKGTCTSYNSGTGELVLDITTAIGTGAIFGMWKVSQTLIDAHTNVPIYIGGAESHFSDANYWPVSGIFAEITGSPLAGDSTITLNDATGFSENQLLQIARKNNYNAAAGESGDNAITLSNYGYDYVERQLTRIVSKSGDTLIISPPLLMDQPIGRVPKVVQTSNYAENVGIEDLAIFSSDSGNLLALSQTIDSWIYRVSCHGASSSQMGFGVSLRSEVRESWSSHRVTPGGSGGPGGKGLGMAYCSGFMIVDSVLYASYPAVELNANVHGAFVNNFMFDGDLNTNHANGTAYILSEGNVVESTLSDSYFGNEAFNTKLRNWFYGANYYTVAPWQIRQSRWVYNGNLVGNKLGTPGMNDGSILLGYPNMGNQTYNGAVNAKDGDYWLHLTSSGPITGTLLTRTNDTAGVIRFDTITAAQFQPPERMDDGRSFHIWWGSNHTLTDVRFKVFYTAASGNDLTFESNGLTFGSNLPVAGTAVKIWGGFESYQEFDNDVKSIADGGTTVVKGNRYAVGQSWGTQESLGGDTLPDSYVFAAKPSSFGSLSWPNDPSSADISSGLAVNPAAYWFYYGELPAGGGGGGGAANAAVNQLNVGTLVIP